ncbi:putative photosystem I PsaJ, reaction centre subunit IX [Helianthus anomalus]
MRDLKTYISVAPVLSTLWFGALADLLLKKGIICNALCLKLLAFGRTSPCNILCYLFEP